MKKRTFLQAVLATGGVAFVSTRYMQNPNTGYPQQSVILPPDTSLAPLNDLAAIHPQEEFELVMLEENELHPGFKHQERQTPPGQIEQIVEQMPEETVDSYLEKIRNFDADFKSDVFLSEQNSLLLLPTLTRLERVQNYVGHANFNLLGFDEMLYFARNYQAIGAFDKAELAFLDEIFSTDASVYGFFGDKVTPDLTHHISQRDVQKNQLQWSLPAERRITGSLQTNPQGRWRRTAAYLGDP